MSAVTGNRPPFRLVTVTEAGREAGVRSIRHGTPGQDAAVGCCFPVDPALRAPDGPRVHAVLYDRPNGSDLLAADDADLLAKLAARVMEKGQWWK